MNRSQADVPEKQIEALLIGPPSALFISGHEAIASEKVRGSAVGERNRALKQHID